MIRASNEFKNKLKNTLEITDGWIQNGVIVAHKEYYHDVRELLCRFVAVIEAEEKPDVFELKTDDELNKEIHDMLRKAMDKIL